jgi:hypothetical protein
MILFNLSQISVNECVSYIDHLQERILVGIRLGMRDGVRGLREAEVEAGASHYGSHYSGSAQAQKPNDLLANILGRAGRVIETGEAITAIYKPRNAGKQPHYWLEYGANIPEVENTRMAMFVGMKAPGVYSAHKAHTLAAQPFFFSAGEAYKGQFYEKLSARVQEAMSA